jgi:hypothetical protein
MLLGTGWGRCWKIIVIAGGWAASMALAAAAEVVALRDTLVYKDGDRVQGRLIETVGGEIVFRSDRFGDLRVPTADAVVIKAEKGAGAASVTDAPAATAPQTPAKIAEAKAIAKDAQRVTIWDQFSPGVLTAKVRDYFGPWHGRLAFSTEVVSDSAERNNHSLEGRLTRKWERDEVQGTARYEYAETNDVLTTDLVKGSGSWRHDFDRRLFAQYRPSAEWDRASKKKGGPTEYVLLQQEFGFGYSVVSTPARKVRLGLSHNLFDLWTVQPSAGHSSRRVPSAFEEIELRLPWQMGFTQRAVWYPVRNQPQGWENRVELNKKLTETLSASIRHEIRRDNPDGSAPDYTRLKLLFGFDF